MTADMNAREAHRTHPEIVKRLRRAEGHLRSVVAMIEDGRPCLDITVVGPMDAAQRQEIDAFKTIAKYL